MFPIDFESRLYEVTFEMPWGYPPGSWRDRAITIREAAAIVRRLLAEAKRDGQKPYFQIWRTGEIGWITIHGSTVIYSDEAQDRTQVAYFQKVIEGAR